MLGRMNRLRWWLAACAALAFFASPDSFAACVQAEGATVCDSQSEAQAYLIANSQINEGASGPIARLVPYTPYPYISSSPPHAGREVFGRYQCYQTLQGVDYNCYSSPNGGLWWWGAGASQCADKAGQSYSGWNYTSTWPPATTGCASNSECKITISIGSAPVPTGGTASLIAYYGTSTYTGQSCSLEDQPVDEADKDDAGEGWKCDPKTGLCTDPNGNGKLCTFNPDGSRSACVDYKPGDGTEPPPPTPEDPNDPRDKESASGGGGCDAAPACSGGQIGCATLWQQWKTRCAVEKAGTTVGSNAVCSERLSTGYACIGDAATCRNLNDTHAIRCSVEALASAGGGEGDGDPFDKASERVAIDAASQGGDGLDGLNPRSAWASPSGGAGVGTGLFGGGGGCPTFPAVVVGNSTFTAPPSFCSYVAMIRLLFLAVAYIWALKIVGD